MRQAQQAETSGNYRAVAHHLEQLYAEEPTPQTVVRWARALRYLGQLQEARSILMAELARLGADTEARPADSPPAPEQESMPYVAERAQLHLELGKVAIAGGQGLGALSHLQTATQLAPDQAETFAALGIAYDLMQSFDAARAQYEKALTLLPEDPEILNNYGLSRALAGDYDRAVALLHQAAALPGSPPQVMMNLAFLKKLRSGAVPDSAAAGQRLGIAGAPGVTSSGSEGTRVEGRPLDLVPVTPSRPPERVPVVPDRSPRTSS